MKNKGFTLVELLGVIIILGLLALVTIPTISDSLSKYKKKLCNTQIDYMITAAKNWGADHMYQLPNEGETVKITLSELIKQGYMEGDKNATNEEDRYKVKNPRADKYFEPDPTISITKTGKKYNYTIDETTQNSCTGAKNSYTVTVLGIHTTVEDGKSITNQIINGSFEDGENGWSTSRVDTPTNKVSGTISTEKAVTGTHSLYINDTSTKLGFWNYQRLTTNAQDVMYLRGKIYVVKKGITLIVTTASSGNLFSNFGVMDPLNTFNTSSKIYTHTSDPGYLQYGICSSCTGEAYIDDVMAINLTQTFGKGQEPSKEDMDKIRYFEGNANISSKSASDKATFTVSAESGYTLPSTVTCSSGTGAITNGVLTIKGMSENTNCVVEATK